MTSTHDAPSNRAVAGIILMAGGWGWISGNFVQPFLPFFYGGFVDILHFLPAMVLLLLSLRFLRASASTDTSRTGTRSGDGRIGITIVAVFSIVACAIFLALGLSNPDPNSVGIHSIEDWLPVIVLNAGVLLWLSTLLPVRRRARVTDTPSATKA